MSNVHIVGDTPEKKEDQINPFNLNLSSELRLWLNQESLSLAFTTYEAGKLVIIGPGLQGGTICTERNFERCMALHIEDESNIWISTHHNIWQLENGLEKGLYFEKQWDRVYLPRSSFVTGGVDVHDIMRANDGFLYGVITGYNCIARITQTEKGSFSPYWKPEFIDQIIGQDRCHLNGMCLDNGELAYVSLVGQSNEANGWRKHKNDGGMIIDMRTNEVIASGLSMPHTPRLYNGYLWFLEAGRGYLCRIDLETKKIERVLWRPGFLRGLRFYKNYALVCCSAPRDKTFNGLPLDKELQKRKEKAQCSIDIISLKTMEVMHSIFITGNVQEVYDVAVLTDCRQPLLYGLMKEDIRKIVVLGPDHSVKINK
ncbi:MAG: TIGR03032 family protein [Saprospiraceae bacterium]|nr:TIGR03032 family protein [Saprospiraceae bacterium]